MTRIRVVRQTITQAHARARTHPHLNVCFGSKADIGDGCFCVLVGARTRGREKASECVIREPLWERRLHSNIKPTNST